MNTYIRLILILFFTISTVQISQAHSGRTDSAGCHTNHSTGEYHCHNSNRAAQTELKFLRAPSSSNSESPKVNQYCCKTCTVGKACGDSCISESKTCHLGAGCACDG